jgi:hypothetical protein
MQGFDRRRKNQCEQYGQRNWNKRCMSDIEYGTDGNDGQHTNRD